MIYKVLDPDGNEHKIEGPEGATDEEIVAQAKLLLANSTTQEGKTQESAPIDWGKVKDNIIPSAKNFAGNMFGAVTHPLKSLKGIDDLIMSAGANLFDDEDPAAKEPFQQAKRAFLDRYGSLDKAKRTLEKDPTGAVLDASGLAQIAGAGVSLIPRLNSIGRAVEVAGNLADPIANVNRSTRLLEKAITNVPGLRDLPERIYENATTFKRPAIRDLALDRGINPARDLESLMQQKRTLGQTLEDIVDAADPNITFPADTLTKGLYNNDAAFMTVPGINNVAEVRNLRKVVKDLEETLGLNQPPINTTILGPNGQPMQYVPNWGTVSAPELSIRQLHDFKKDTWDQIYKNKPASEVKLTPGGQVAKRHIANNALDAIRPVLPDAYTNYSAEYGKLKDLVREIEPMSRTIKRTEESMKANADRFAAKSLAVGTASGHPIIGGSAAGGSWIGRLLNSPTRRIDRAIRMKDMRDYGFTDFANPVVSGATPLMDLLDEIERKRQERLRKQLMRP